MALSPEFSLKNITRKFLSNLEGQNKLFFEGFCGPEEDLSFGDFEEAAFDSLKRYNTFINSEVGKSLLENFSLMDPMLYEHEKIIGNLYKQYISHYPWNHSWKCKPKNNK